MSPRAQTGSLSSADKAFDDLRKLIESRALMLRTSPKLSEADTRAKLIDPLFRDVLGWSEVEIRREAPASTGWADYVLGADLALLLVEAKRSKPRFQLSAAESTRRLKLSGPHLLGNKNLAPNLRQARDYAAELGAQAAALTNGDQFILFRPYLSGHRWEDGYALIWHSYNDILDSFAEFFRLLSRDAVSSGILLQELEQQSYATQERFTPLSFIANPDSELRRNAVWNKISKVMAPLLSDLPTDLQTQLDILQHCYVSTPISDQADASLDRLLRDTPSRTLDEAGVIPTSHTSGKNRFGRDLDTDVKLDQLGTYILTGGVGSGKTTFLKHFPLVSHRPLISEYCVWMHLDFLSFGDPPDTGLDQALKDFSTTAMRTTLEQNYPQHTPASGEDLRYLFQEQIDEATRTILFRIPENSETWTLKVNEIVHQCYQDDSAFLSAVLKRLRQRGLRPVIVLDNTDQLGEAFQESVFLYAQSLSSRFRAFCIVALREEKFFAAYRRGIFDAFGDRRFHLGSPNLREVLRARLEFGRARFAELNEPPTVGFVATSLLSSMITSARSSYR